MKKYDKEIVGFIFSSNSKRDHRVLFFEKTFLYFLLYYFPNEFTHPLAPFHIEYIETLEDGIDVFFVGFRECAKTMILTYYYVWVIVYAKRRYILHYNSDKTKAQSILSDVISELQENEKIVADFGFLYIPEEGIKRGSTKKKSISEFVTENGVKMKAMSIGTSPRGEKFKYKSVTYRPDLISFDDIDTIQNTNNSEIIEKDIIFLTGEAFGGFAAYSQMIFLGNTIAQDGRIPRLKKHFESDLKNNIKIFWIPIRQKGKIVWSRFVSTDKEANLLNKNIQNPKERYISLEEKRRKQGTIGFNQNFNLIAYQKGQKIIKESDIKHYGKLPNSHKIVMGIDPAFSLKTSSDAIGLSITAQEKFEKEIYKYVIEIMEFREDEKDEERFCRKIVDLYCKYGCSMIYIEGNNGGEILARMLKKRGLAVTVISTTRDKVTRLREYQGEFERGMIQFNPDDSKVGKGIEQIINFPNVENDDMMDAVINSFIPYIGGDIRAI